MPPRNRIPSHPGAILQDEFLVPAKIPLAEFAIWIGMPVQRLEGLISGECRVTQETASLLGLLLGTTPAFWLNLQANHDEAARD